MSPGISQRWLVLARRGSCGVTERGAKGLCTYGDQGAFSGLALDGLLQGTRRNWSAAATACLEQCASCERCRFVTLNIGPFFDCSWFSSCKLSDLAQGQGHISGKVPWARDTLRTDASNWQPRCPRGTPGAHKAQVATRQGARQHAAGGAGSCGRGNTTASCSVSLSEERAAAALVHMVRLRLWAACNEVTAGGAGDGAVTKARAAVILSAAGKDAAHHAGVSDQQLIMNLPLAAAGFKPRSDAARAVVAAAPCLTPACVARALAGKWIVFYGDSTARQVFGGLLGLLSSRYSARLNRYGPTLGGEEVKGAAHTGQCDSDVWGTLPDLAADAHKSTAGIEGGGSGDAGGGGGNGTDAGEQLLISMRFMRGLDLHKLRQNIASPHRRLFYPYWWERSREMPTTLLLEADAPELQTRRRVVMGRPDVVVFHSCAWDMPRINRSKVYYSDQECAEENEGERWVDVRLANKGGKARARALGAGCRLRGDGLTDEQIYDGYEQSLRHALALLRAQVAGGDSLLMVRNCHPGSGGANVRGRHENESQHESVMRINGIIARVAAELCIPVLDVYALDAAAGFYWQDGAPPDFHAPTIASLQAALAVLLAMVEQASCAHNTPALRDKFTLL